jgi:NAD(P)-dependent dehydrogenase (short-subunit alcohol dehydrogenase family)
MKIAITGHTSGIGKALADGFLSQGHKIIGFDCDTLGNISTDAGIDEIINSIADCDIFVNNASDATTEKTCMGFAQAILLYKVWNKWQGQDKKIITISSRAPECVNGMVWMYAIQKEALDNTVSQLRNVTEINPHIINLKLGYVDTERVAKVSKKKIDPLYVFQICDWVLKQPEPIFEMTLGSVSL